MVLTGNRLWLCLMLRLYKQHLLRSDDGDESEDEDEDEEAPGRVRGKPRRRGARDASPPPSRHAKGGAAPRGK